MANQSPRIAPCPAVCSTMNACQMSKSTRYKLVSSTLMFHLADVVINAARSLTLDHVLCLQLHCLVNWPAW